ncbi:hypothetical protein ASD24_23140 [Paenibacillus sp. Root52]|uniref:hypothetical protein n=1 Tax=Paenibacillus sp. Root52 TaxID=1736552 RepID=UPI0006FFD646|nr:hypothetical protein [Paenibacillus sp. Root52]KQY91632.1 hypothetical protein ASD24_23140 [Paenibacillus sp. Root52]
MTVVSKRLGRGGLTTSSAALYTVPANTTTIIKAITICNSGNTPVTFDLSFHSIWFAYEHTMKPNDTLTIPNVDQILTAGEAIRGKASNANVTYHISGKEVI